MSMLHKVLISSPFAATVLSGSAASPAAAANYSYGGVKFFGRPTRSSRIPARAATSCSLGAAPSTLPSDNGQCGNVTHLGGVHPYTYPGQVGNLTYMGANMPHTRAGAHHPDAAHHPVKLIRRRPRGCIRGLPGSHVK